MRQGTFGRHRRAIAGATATALAAAVAVASLGSAGAAPTAASAKKKAGVGLQVTSKTFRLSQPDNSVRYETICPKGKFPYGGGIKSDPAPANGEGVYPNSFERLGAQHGYHVNGTLVDVNGSSPAPRDVTIQAVCGSKPGKITPPHETTFVDPGQTKSLTLNCKGDRTLLGGGFQRTTGRSRDGNLITEARAISGKAWRVTSHGQGSFGGELTGMAYCVKSKKPVLKELSATVQIGNDQTATATTPSCPKGRKGAFGGFETASDGSVMYFGGYFTSSGAWAASGYNSGPPTSLTAYVYCLRPFKK